MSRLIREIIDLLKRERFYQVLLIVLICFYLGLFLYHRQTGKPAHKIHTKTKTETIFDQASNDSKRFEEKLSKNPKAMFLAQAFMLMLFAGFLLGIWFGSGDIKKWFEGRGLIPLSGFNPVISWGASEVVKVIMLFTAAGIGLNVLLSIPGFLFGKWIDESFFMMFHTILVDTAIVIFIVWIVRQKGSGFKDVLGFDFPRISKQEAWLGVRTYLVILPVFFAILLVLIFIIMRMKYEPPPHPLVEVFMKDEKTSPWLVVYALFLACAVGPVVEEIFFRGFFYPAIRRYLGLGWAMVITGAFFAAVHENLFSFLPILFLGVALCYLYERRANLVSCIVLHVIHNTVFISYFFLMRGVLGNGGLF